MQIKPCRQTDAMIAYKADKNVMNIAIIGTGYVGLTTGVCLADFGHTVVCVDINEEKVSQLQTGHSPIFETGLEALLQKNIAEQRVRFTTDLSDGVKNADVVFFAVQTPEGEYGKANLSFLFAAVSSSAVYAKNAAIFVNRSTAPVGTVAKLREIVISLNRSDISICSNPEFLSEGNVVENFFHPDRVVIGADDDHARDALTEVYRVIINGEHPLVITTSASAEVIKYAANAFLAMKISFINEIADFCELVDADVKEVARGIGHDKRIGPHFLDAGIGYGGSCFGKDTKALVARGEEQGHEFKIIKALSTVNDMRYAIVLNKLKKYYPDLKGRRIAVLGLAFKPMTNDVRDTPAERIIFELLESKASVAVYDPVAMPEFKKLFKQASSITFGSTLYETLMDADACIIITKWNEFKNCDLQKIKSLMKGDVIIDGRNMFERSAVENAGFRYEGVGR